MKEFDPRDFLMKTIKGMIGHYIDFQVREWAADWWKIGKLSDEDMAEIDELIEMQYVVVETPSVDEIVDEHEPMVIPEIIEDETEEPVVEETETVENPEVLEENNEPIEDEVIEETEE